MPGQLRDPVLALGMSVVVAITVAMTAPLGCTRETRTLPPCDTSAELPQLRGKKTIEVVTAGDVADCSSDAHHRTAALIERIQPDVVLALGDLAYPFVALFVLGLFVLGMIWLIPKLWRFLASAFSGLARAFGAQPRERETTGGR